MNKLILLVIMALLITSPAIAWENNYETSRQKQERERNKEYPYESTSGTRYKYDLSKPSDRIRYEVDPAAQIRDSINPRVKIDRGLGQHGGGSE
jgi:hypothetical protein